MGWMRTGYDQAEDTYKQGFGDGNRGPQRVWMKPDESRVILMLDDDPAIFWEHEIWLGKSKIYEPCALRNKIADRCFPCEKYQDENLPDKKKRYPYCIGLHTCINFTGFVTKKGATVKYRREIYAAHYGTNKRPGVLRKLERIKADEGRLRGLLLEAHRPGETERCGSEFKILERIDPTDEAIKAFSRKHLPDYGAEIGVEPKDLWDRNPWVPFDFEDEDDPAYIKPRSYEEMKGILGASDDDCDFYGGGSKKSNGGGDGGDREDNGREDGDDDVPY